MHRARMLRYWNLSPGHRQSRLRQRQELCRPIAAMLRRSHALRLSYPLSIKEGPRASLSSRLPINRTKYAQNRDIASVKFARLLVSLPDNLRPHGSKNREHFLLSGLGDVRFVHRCNEIFDERVEVLVGQIQSAMRFFHRAARIFARSACRFAHLLDHQTTQIVVVYFCEQGVDARVGIEALEE